MGESLVGIYFANPWVSSCNFFQYVIVLVHDIINHCRFGFSGRHTSCVCTNVCYSFARKCEPDTAISGYVSVNSND